NLQNLDSFALSRAASGMTSPRRLARARKQENRATRAQVESRSREKPGHPTIRGEYGRRAFRSGLVPQSCEDGTQPRQGVSGGGAARKRLAVRRPGGPWRDGGILPRPRQVAIPGRFTPARISPRARKRNGG